MELPTFRYHPNAYKSGRIATSDAICPACQQARGYAYMGQPYGRKSYSDCICPWCIADGTAHDKLAVEFNDAGFIGGGGMWESVSAEIVAEVAYRTPGFSTWQGDKWFTHCDDAAAFLGVMGYKELKAAGKKAIRAIREDGSFSDDDDWEEFFEALDKEGSPTAYLFQCLHCGQYDGFTDCD